MVMCIKCNGQTGDEIPICHACADKQAKIGYRRRKFEESQTGLSSFGAEIAGEPDFKKAAKRLVERSL